MRAGLLVGSEVADTDTAVRVNAEDFVERKNDCRGSRDDCAADDGHLALVNVAPPDGEAAVDDTSDAEHETEHHNHGEAVADACLEFGGIECLPEGGQGVEGEDGGNRKERRQPRANFRCDFLCELHSVYFFVFFPSADFPPITRSQSHKRGKRRCM